MTKVDDGPARMASVFDAQRAHLPALKGSSASDRIERLTRLRASIIAHGDAIDRALHDDLRKALAGHANAEIQSVLHDIDEAIGQLGAWMADELVETSPGFAGNRAFIRYEPRGAVLLLGPWNFPFALVFAPLVPIIAAGNSCIIKPNELQPATSEIVAKIVSDCFGEREVAVFQGGVQVAEALQNLPFDHVFFTGSPAVGKRVMAAASRHLSSVTLELGGKCPAVIGPDYDLTDAAGKCVGARFTNAGQLCLAVDHVWVPRAQVPHFVAIASAIIDRIFYVDGTLQRERMSRLVDGRNFDRVMGYLDDATARGATIARGGAGDRDDLTIHPTLLVDVPMDARIMQEEIFGPLLPIIAYDDLDEVVAQIEKTGKPLATYIFSNDRRFVDGLLMRTTSGGVTVNHVVMHYLETRLPFGGVNGSGIGRYKGIHGFRELSHGRSVFVSNPDSIR